MSCWRTIWSPVLDFASNTFSIKLGAADLPAVDPNGRALLDTLAAAMRADADFTLRRGLIWDPARQELAVTILRPPTSSNRIGSRRDARKARKKPRKAVRQNKQAGG